MTEKEAINKVLPLLAKALDIVILLEFNKDSSTQITATELIQESMRTLTEGE